MVFAASTRTESAEERDDWGHGAFSKALIEALTGEADGSTYREGQVTVSLLDAWIEARVNTLTQNHQHPIYRRPWAVPDFAVAELARTSISRSAIKEGGTDGSKSAPSQPGVRRPGP